MKISKKTQEALNKQMNLEFESAYTYLAMAAHFESENLTGMASWMHKQVQEEWAHGMKIFNYLLDRGAQPDLMTIEKPKNKYSTPLDVFDTALKHEEKVSEAILKTLEVADAENDKAAHIFLHWYVEEQVEEESTVGAIVEKLKLIANAPGGLLMLDKDLAQRQQ